MFAPTKHSIPHTGTGYQGIPLELRNLPNWLGFRLIQTPEKLCKEPIDGASSTESATWRTFAEAASQIARKRADVPGFALPADRSFTGIDLDHCLTADGEMKDWAAPIVAPFQRRTYIERTPSGEGLRIWTRGSKPGKRCKRLMPNGGAVEIYDHDRMFTVTGQPYQDAPAMVAEMQDEISALYAELFPPIQREAASGPQAGLGALDMDDEELLTRARNAKDGARFCALFDAGDLSGNGGDHSAADLALCNILAFWCGPDADRIDRLFRRSALYREKWERPDYAFARTIDTALDGRTEFYSGSRRTRAEPAATPAPEIGNQIEFQTPLSFEEAVARLALVEAENAALRSENQRLKDANVRLNQRLQWEREAESVSNKVLGTSPRQTLSLLRRDLEAKADDQRDEDGYMRIDTATMAKRYGISASTLSRNISEAETVGAIEVKRYEVQTSKGPRPRIAIKETPKLLAPKAWQRPGGEERNMGGTRENAGRKPKCESCGEESVTEYYGVEIAEREIVKAVCSHCGAIHQRHTGKETVITTRMYEAPEPKQEIPNQFEKETDAPASETPESDATFISVEAHPIVPDFADTYQAPIADARAATYAPTVTAWIIENAPATPPEVKPAPGVPLHEMCIDGHRHKWLPGESRDSYECRMCQATKRRKAAV